MPNSPFPLFVDGGTEASSLHAHRNIVHPGTITGIDAVRRVAISLLDGDLDSARHHPRARRDDRILGNAGDAVICGGDGYDLVSGDAGNDQLLGDVGNDTILGRDDNDALDGGDNADICVGDAGVDAALRCEFL